ncbi:hypothetical protein U5B43_06925 [Campylobacter sp. 9BO]|uniref:hypothetical protein n=1 Tax=Campylobacter sp. 9BO TaxID=3424759 RepID=UPI003D3273F7
MKQIIELVFAMVFLVGCGQNQPKVPTASAFKFDKIDYIHIQHHQPTKFTYQSPQDVEKKYNDQILDALKNSNLLDQNSTDELKISIKHHREFVGEATSLKSDRIANIWLYYNIQIIRNGEILRQYISSRERYDPGFFGNLKTIAMQNKDNKLENDAISAMAHHIIKIIKENFKG